MGCFIGANTTLNLVVREVFNLEIKQSLMRGQHTMLKLAVRQIFILPKLNIMFQPLEILNIIKWQLLYLHMEMRI